MCPPTISYTFLLFLWYISRCWISFLANNKCHVPSQIDQKGKEKLLGETFRNFMEQAALKFVR